MVKFRDLLLCATLLLAIACGGNTTERDFRSRVVDINEKSVNVITHRADWRNHPENSINAIKSAIEMGADMVEIDLKRTSDGVFILMHDLTLNRTTTGSGRASDMTMEQISELYLRNGCAIKTNNRVPTLEEALAVTKGKIMVNIDHAYDYFPEIYPILERLGMVDQVVLKGTKSIEQVAEDLEQYPTPILYMPIISLDDANASEQIDLWLNYKNPPFAFELLFKDDSNPLPKEMVERLNGRAKIWYNTLWSTLCGGHDDDMAVEDIDGAYGYIIDTLGASMIQTDRPQYLIDYLKRRGEHR
ncbi:MAG: glycerophosphodiester phosphodiesterase family protein [Rikenellaceae bacterium]